MWNTDESWSMGSVLIVGVDLGFGGDEGQSDQTGDDQVVVLDGWLGVLGFECVLIWDFGEVHFADVESVRQVFPSSALEGAVDHVIA